MLECTNSPILYIIFDYISISRVRIYLKKKNRSILRQLKRIIYTPELKVLNSQVNGGDGGLELHVTAIDRVVQISRGEKNLKTFFNLNKSN